jgi:selenide,water dikinase
VGNGSHDDAAVYDLGNGTALISTTDFFMPVVDDAFDFGQIASANAISDVYAMGGRPLVAIALLGWPVDKLPASLAKEVLDGARETCAKAGITLAGGHSIDSAEPFFGLAVNGLVATSHLKRNNTAREGDLLFLTRPVGTGILSTAQKRGRLKDEDLERLLSHLTTLNSIGEELGKIPEVSAMTDVTGFGLAGHLIEMAEGSGLSAELYYSRVGIIENVRDYLAQGIIPDATYRNWNAYSKKISFDDAVNVTEAFSLLPDPQTNGGLLIAVHPGAAFQVTEILNQQGLEKFSGPIGTLIPRDEKVIRVRI